MPKTAFVTGNRGFIGRHITRELLRRGYRVLGVDASAVDNAQSCFRRLEDRFDLVVHCAYVVGGRATIDGRNTALIENTMLDSMLFDWALRTKQKAVIYFSSSAAYPVHLQEKSNINDWTYHPLHESEINFSDVWTAQMPDSNYGWAKLTGERLGRVAADNGLRVHTLRPFSGYAEDQTLDYPFPSIIRRAKNFDFTVWGPEGQCRQWIHVSDVVNGALAIYENNERRPVNLGHEDGVEMGQLMKMAAKQLHGFEPDVIYDESKPTGVFHRVGDLARMHEHYVGKISLEEGIIKAVSTL